MLWCMPELWNPSIPTDRDWRITWNLMDDLAWNIQYGNNNKRGPASTRTPKSCLLSSTCFVRTCTHNSKYELIKLLAARGKYTIALYYSLCHRL